MTAPPLPSPSPFFELCSEALREAAARGPVLDLAAGRGRHALAAARLGARVAALDRSADALAALAARARAEALRVWPLRADLERGDALPFAPRRFAAVLVFRYLHRPLAPAILEALAPGGLLVYETFTLAQRALAHGPRNPDFLLRPGELPRLFAPLEVLRSEELTLPGPPQEHLARLLARAA